MLRRYSSFYLTERKVDENHLHVYVNHLPWTSNNDEQGHQRSRSSFRSPTNQTHNKVVYSEPPKHVAATLTRGDT